MGCLNQRLDDRQPLLPASGQCGSLQFEILKTRSAQRLGKVGTAFGVGGQRAFGRSLDDIPDARSSDKPRILFDVAESEALSYRHVAAVGLFGPAQNSQQCGFSGAVRADQPNSVSPRNCKRDILEKWLRSKCFRDILDVNDRRQGYGPQYF